MVRYSNENRLVFGFIKVNCHLSCSKFEVYKKYHIKVIEVSQ